MRKSYLIPVEILQTEDKIMPLLSVKQLFLLLANLFLLITLFFCLPPSGQLVFYKSCWLILSGLLGFLPALKLRGLLLAEWLALIVKYNLRPKSYVDDQLLKKTNLESEIK